MSIDFKKHTDISTLLDHAPMKVHHVMLRHDESGTYSPQLTFFYKSDAQKACDWLNENDEIDHGLGHYELDSSELRRYKQDFQPKEKTNGHK